MASKLLQLKEVFLNEHFNDLFLPPRLKSSLIPHCYLILDSVKKRMKVVSTIHLYQGNSIMLKYKGKRDINHKNPNSYVVYKWKANILFQRFRERSKLTFKYEMLRKDALIETIRELNLNVS